MRDVRGKPGKTVPWLTALGWTCIGDVNSTDQGGYRTRFPWKDDRSVLPYSYEPARRRLSGTEKCIPKEPEERLGNEDPKNREKSNWVLLHTTLSCYKAGKSNDGDVRCF